MELKAILSTHTILNFPNLYSETVEVERFIHSLTQNKAKLEELPEWKIVFHSLFGKGSFVGVSKKGFTYPSYPPEKIYYIYIPIPTVEEIDWGIRKKDFINTPPLDESFKDKVEGIEFSDFDSLSSYIVECSKKGIEQWLKKGISLKGIKIKV